MPNWLPESRLESATFLPRIQAESATFFKWNRRNPLETQVLIPSGIPESQNPVQVANRSDFW